MASIEQRNENYRIVFRYQGRRFSRSLDTTDEGAAIAAKSLVEQRINLIKTKLLPEPAENDDVFEYLVRGNSQRKKQIQEKQVNECKPTTFGQICSAYFENFLRSSVEDNSFQTMELHKRHLLRHIGTMKLGDNVNQSAVQAYIAKRADEPGIRGSNLSPVTIKKEITTLKTIISWAKAEGFVRSVFESKGLRFPKGKEKPPFQTFDAIERKIDRGDLSAQEQAELWECLFLSTSEIASLLKDVESNARHSFLYPMIAFAAHTGARRSELLRSKIDDIDMEQRQILIREKKRVKGNSSSRRVPMSGLLHSVLDAWLQSHPGGQSLFCLSSERISKSKKSRSFGEQLTKDEAHDHFKITLSGTRWSKIRGWHCLRHSFCSNCAEAGIEQRVINSWVGHQTEEMVRRYRHLFPSYESKAIETVFGQTLN